MKQKWTMLIDLMPGPSEPQQNLYSFLRPLVDNLLLLWNGIEVDTKSGERVIGVQATLLCVSGDILAICKVSQFLGHKALLGCSRCPFSGEKECDECGKQSGRMSYFSKMKSFMPNATRLSRNKEKNG